MKLLEVMRYAAGSRFFGLGPDAFHGIEFGRIGWKMKNVQARLACQKRFDQPPGADRMVIPDQHNLPRDGAQALLEKPEDMLAVECAAPQVTEHPEATTTRRDQQGPQRIDPLVV